MEDRHSNICNNGVFRRNVIVVTIIGSCWYGNINITYARCFNFDEKTWCLKSWILDRYSNEKAEARSLQESSTTVDVSLAEECTSKEENWCVSSVKHLSCHHLKLELLQYAMFLSHLLIGSSFQVLWRSVPTNICVHLIWRQWLHCYCWHE